MVGVKIKVREFVKYNLPAFFMKTFWKVANFPKGVDKLLFTNSFM
jgi:alpha-D-ribose 1-methylphosphonate 5-triphosphate synthase subunit PhnH